MRLILVFTALMLILNGCAVKIVPGHTDEAQVQKATVQMHEEPEPVVPEPVEERISAAEYEAESNVTEAESAEEEIAFEEEEEAAKPRFPKSKLIASVPYRVTMKTKKFAFSDTGFVNRYDNMINLQILSMGKPVLDLVIRLDESKICTDKICYTKHAFNRAFLSSDYPDSLIENVLQSEPIVGGKELKKTTNGFMQKIATKAYVIKYKIWPGNIYFKDIKNGIIIRLRKLSK